MTGSGLFTGHRVIDVRLEDEYGTFIRMVPVEVEYLLEVDKTHGADADGNRFIHLRSVTLWDAYINPSVLRHLTSAQVEEVIHLVRRRLEEGLA